MNFFFALTLSLGGAPSVSSATELLDDWQLEDAIAVTQTLLAAAPSDDATRILTAEVLHQRGQHLQALDLLRSVEAQQRSGMRSIAELIEASAAYAAAFATLETEHFRIKYISKDEIVAFYAKPVLEAAYAAIGRDLQFLPAERGEKIVVEIYPDARGLAGATGLTLKEIETSGTIAVCKFHRLMITSPLATADGYSWADTLAHEFTHLVISKKSRNTVPIWLHEGIAKFFESRWSGTAGRALSPYSEELLANAVKKGKFITFAQMHPSMAKLPSQTDAALAFAEVFTVIEFLTQRFGTASVGHVLAALGEGVALEKALQKVFGMGLPGIEKAWKQYLSKRPFRRTPNAPAPLIRLSSEEKKSVDAEGKAPEQPLETIQNKEVHAAARLGELLQLRGHPKAAVAEYEKAMARGGDDYATLVNRLARVYVELNRPGEATQLIERQLHRHPDDADAHLLAGRLRLKSEDWDKAKQHYEAARLQNPFNPEIHAALAVLYQREKNNESVLLEQRFLQLSQHPRPTRTYEIPAKKSSDATLSITTLPWSVVRVDEDTAVAAPAWDYPVKAGEHRITWTRPDGTATAKTITIAAHEHQIVVLQ